MQTASPRFAGRLDERWPEFARRWRAYTALHAGAGPQHGAARLHMLVLALDGAALARLLSHMPLDDDEAAMALLAEGALR